MQLDVRGCRQRAAWVGGRRHHAAMHQAAHRMRPPTRPLGTTQQYPHPLIQDPGKRRRLGAQVLFCPPHATNHPPAHPRLTQELHKRWRKALP